MTRELCEVAARLHDAASDSIEQLAAASARADWPHAEDHTRALERLVAGILTSLNALFVDGPMTDAELHPEGASMMSAPATRRPGAYELSAFAQRPASTAALSDGRRVLMHHGTPVGSFAVQARERGSGSPLAMHEVDAAADVVLAIEQRRADARGLAGGNRRLREVIRDALKTLRTFEVLAVDQLARDRDDDRLARRLRKISAGSLRATEIEKAVAAAVIAAAGPNAVRDALTNRAERRAAARGRRTRCT